MDEPPSAGEARQDSTALEVSARNEIRVTGGLRKSLALIGSLLGIGALFAAAALSIDAEGPDALPGVGNVSIHELQPANDDSWSVLILADVQGGFHYLPEIFARGAAWKPNAVIVLGDLSNDPDRERMQLPVRTLRRHPPPAPLFVVPGNHDIDGEKGRQDFLRWFGSTTFDLRIGRTRLLGANNADGPLAPAALAELGAKLAEAASRGQQTILCFHRDIVDWRASPVWRRSRGTRHCLR